ncbi:MAG: hypothetical protein K9H61_01700 [Bacteroidia bacterium]|nr:hypothetical protein [Bacteroidia bacterium]MCF8425613.1 hypothetical protein [Bacteroidia bacterium]MCF8445684.1 hypothetical protein [Bacteroidia bacterium]
MNKKIALLAIVIFAISFLSHAQNTKDSTEQKFLITVAMPFCSQQVLAEPKNKNLALSNACRQYYEGLVLAMDSFRRAEIPIEIKVYDTKKDSGIFNKILTKKEVQNSDLIIGPVLKEGNEKMIGFCKKYKIYHISPFFTLSKSKIENPYLISAYPDLGYYGDYFLEKIDEAGGGTGNITVITGKESNDKLISARILSLKSKYPGFTINSLDISKYNDYRKLYKPGGQNHVIISCETEFLVGTTLKYLADTTLFLDLQVYGFRKWLDFKTPNIPLMEQLNVKIISPYYFDYSDLGVKQFIEKYRERYYTEPSEYSLAGFEQGLFFIGSLFENHGNLGLITKQTKNKPLCNWYQIRQKLDQKSLQNSKLNLLYFEEGILKRLVETN